MVKKRAKAVQQRRIKPHRFQENDVSGAAMPFESSKTNGEMQNAWERSPEASMPCWIKLCYFTVSGLWVLGEGPSSARP